jgi:predicted Rossmann fold nucleotide-binding protein DprA/Smf involved in DNA uptake
MESLGVSNFLKQFKGRWLAISGNRWVTPAIAKKVEAVTKAAILAGCYLVTGGAEGVDHAVIRACLKYKLPKGRLKVFLPYTIHEQYVQYRKMEGAAKARLLQHTLLTIQRMYPRAVVENRRRF